MGAKWLTDLDDNTVKTRKIVFNSGSGLESGEGIGKAKRKICVIQLAVESTILGKETKQGEKESE